MSSEPLSMSIRSAEAPKRHRQLRARAFVFSSRGDRVPGRLWLPALGDGPHPLVLLAHGAGGAKDAPYMDAAAGPWADRGLAVASIDFPLHGERSDAKLSPLLLAEFWNDTSIGRLDAGRPIGLAAEFARQTSSDLDRALQAVAELPEVDADRLGFAGFNLGAIVGSHFCGGNPRVRVAVLALGGAGLGQPGFEAADPIAAFAPRPLLLVNVNDDARVPRAAAEALFEAARQPKQQLWFDGTHTQLPRRALKAMFEFLAEHLHPARSC